MVKIIDNFFDKDTHKNIWGYCNNVSYKVGEKDGPNTLPTGGVFEIELDNDLFNFLDSNLKNKFSELNNLTCYRSYINCFSPSENPYFHIDSSKGYTCLFYPNLEFELDEGGETQFLIDNEIKGVLPIPNRMVLFNANIKHKATSFRTKHRFTLAIKYR